MEIILGVLLASLLILFIIVLRMNTKINRLQSRVPDRGEPEVVLPPQEITLKYTADMGKPEEIEWQVINGHLCLLWNKKIILYVDKDNGEFIANDFGVKFGRNNKTWANVHQYFLTNMSK